MDKKQGVIFLILVLFGKLYKMQEIVVISDSNAIEQIEFFPFAVIAYCQLVKLFSQLRHLSPRFLIINTHSYRFFTSYYSILSFDFK